MKTLFVLNDPPYGTRRSHNALRLINALGQREGEEIKAFLLGDAAACAKAGQKVPQGYYCVDTMIKSALRKNVAAARHYLEEDWGNPSSAHVYGQKAKQGVVRARESVAAMLGAPPASIILTSGGTDLVGRCSFLIGALDVRSRHRRRAVVASAGPHALMPFRDSAQGIMGAMSPEYFSVPARSGLRVAPQSPPAAIVEDGRIHMGLYSEPVRHMNLHAARLLQRARGILPVPALLVEWIGAGLAHPEWYFGMIVVDAKVLSLAVFYGYHRKTGKYFSHDRIGLPGRARVAESTWNGVTAFEGLGFRSAVTHDLARGRHEFTVGIRRFGKRPAVNGKLTWHEPLGATQPLVLLSPAGKNGFIYNHRAQMPLEGELLVGGERVRFDPRRDVGNLDEVRLHPSGNGLSYHWFNFGGFDDRGRVVGVDLALTPQKPDPWWSENCLWVGDKLWLCGEVRFDKDPRDLMRPWRARDERGNIDITFHPEGGKKVSLGPVGTYHQKCGRFSGRIVDGAGETHVIRDYLGCAEHADILLGRRTK